MNGDQRRNEIIALLRTNGDSISGTTLAKHLNVSRQIIVSDIALLKASNHTIISTSKGYSLMKSSEKRRVFKVRHSTEEIGDELYSMIEPGGYVIDVFVRHKMYGELRADLFLRSKKDVDDFIHQLLLGNVQPLKQLTDDYHFHTVGADSDQVLDSIQKTLNEKGYLVEG